MGIRGLSTSDYFGTDDDNLLTNFKKFNAKPFNFLNTGNNLGSGFTDVQSSNSLFSPPSYNVGSNAFGQDYSKGTGNTFNYNAGSSWKDNKGSGLFGMGTAGNWETGIGLANAVGGLYGLKLQKDSLADTKKNNAFNASLGMANYDMKYDAFNADFLEAQGKSAAVGDWVASQGGDSSKYMTMAGLALPKRANLSYG
jgi:hypothetical protein